MRSLLALLLVLVVAGSALAYRVPSRKTVIPPAPGARGDITVPYLTNGTSTLGVYNGVGPIIYSSPLLTPPNNPQIRPVFNLPFYGSKLGPSPGVIGATPTPAPRLRPGR